MNITGKTTHLLTSISDLPYGTGGGKAQGLKFLSDLNLSVPDAFVLEGVLTSVEKGDNLFHLLNAGSLAVRSSSEEEDQGNYSAAGQYETVLNICTGSELIEAVEICRSSGNTERVKSYHRNRETGAAAEERPIPLIIQKMICPRAAGVIFTMDPVSGSRGHLLVEAAEGTGEKVVDGTSPTSSYRIDKNGYGTTCTGDSILSEKILKDLEKGALLAEAEAGQPLDLEWAVDSTGKLWWLQSRPVTTLNDYQLNSTVLNDHWVITTGNIGEVFPGSTTPLTYSTAGIALDVGMQEMYRTVGVPLKGNQREFFINYYDNHLFFLMNNVWCMSPYVLGSSENQMDLSICGTIVENRGKLPRKKNIFRRSFNLFRYMKLLLNPDRVLEEMEQIASDFSIPLPQNKESASELYNNLIDNQKLLNHAYYLHYSVSGHSALMNILLEKSVKNKDAILLYMSDIPDIESALIPRALQKIAGTIMTVLQYEDFLEMEMDKQLEWIYNQDAVKQLWTDFMGKHGHRSIKELEMREKEWKVSPDIILTNLTGIIRSLKNQDSVSPEVEEKKETKYPKTVRNARNGVRKRERSKSLLVRIQNQFKTGWRQLSEHLVSLNLLEKSDMIYFLTAGEIGSLLAAGNNEKEILKLQKMAETRFEQFADNDLLHFPRISYGRPMPVDAGEQTAEIPGDSNLKGIPVSKGIQTGNVRIVHTKEDADKLQTGEIMVSTFTDIGWSPYYSICGGLITELGSPLSHGAVVAREYGIPLVSCVQNATSLLKTGDIVRVNGTSGQVELIREENR